VNGPIARLRDAVRATGSPLAATLTAQPGDGLGPADGPDPALVAAAGPRARSHRAEVELAVVAVHEGYRLHYTRPLALPIDDPDLALLAGDRLYALGLAQLAEIGDLTAIAELADVIALSAQAHAGGDAELARAGWHASAAAIGWGPDRLSIDAKQRARAGDPGGGAEGRRSGRR
jgi:hypothetical protein